MASMTVESGLIEECRSCGSSDLHSVIDMGHIPLVDNFLDDAQLRKPEIHYPLHVVLCGDCKLVQLDYLVPPQKMYHDEYGYDMSVTMSGVEHFESVADELLERYPETDSVLDIGSNSGTLLDRFSSHGVAVLGVDPSDNVAQRARDRGIETITEFFDSETAAEIVSEYGSFDLVTGTNVFAHIPDLHDAVEGVDTLLAEGGVFAIEVPYLRDLVEKNEFDTIYHEHLSYYSVRSLQNLFDPQGFEIVDVIEQDIHGGSVQVHVARVGERTATDRVEEYLTEERQSSLNELQTFESFRESVETIRADLVDLVHRLRSEGHTVAGVGAPAKGVTLLNYCGLDERVVPYVSEKSAVLNRS